MSKDLPEKNKEKLYPAQDKFSVDSSFHRLLIVGALTGVALLFVITLASLALTPSENSSSTQITSRNENKVLAANAEKESKKVGILGTIFKPLGSFTLWLLHLNDTSAVKSLDPLAATLMNETFVLDGKGNVIVTKPLILKEPINIEDGKGGLLWGSISGTPSFLSSINMVTGDDGNVKLVEGSNINISNDKQKNTITIASTASGGTLVGSDVSLTSGSGISVSGTSPDFTITNTNLGGSQKIFKNVAVSGQSTLVADKNNDTLTVAAGSGISLTTSAGSDTLTIASSGSSVPFANITGGTNTNGLFIGTGGSLGVSGSGTITATNLIAASSVVSDAEVDDTLTIGAGGSVAASVITGSLTDAQVADTLTISAGSVAAGIISGSLTDAQVSNTLTVDGTGSINADAINSGTLGVAGVTLALGSFGSTTGSLGDANVSDTLTIGAGGSVAAAAVTGSLTDAQVADTITASNYLPLAGGTMAGTLGMGNNLIQNIGAAGTDFIAGGGLNIATDLNVAGHGAFGGSGSISSATILDLSETIDCGASNCWGVSSVLTNTSSGVPGLFAAGRFEANQTDTDSSITQLMGLYTKVSTPAGGNSVGSSYGLYIDNGLFVAPGTAYGIMITDMAAGTKQYGIYTAGTNDMNILSGNTRIGSISDPTVSLDVTGSANISVNLGVTGTVTGASSISGTTLISTIATGTAPLTVSSTTKVANLNVDLLDGLTATGFLLSTTDSFTSGTLTFNSGTTLSVLGSFSCTDCVGDTAVVDTITASNYLPLAGGTMSGTLAMGSNLITDIGNAGTDFVAGGGLTLADKLTVSGTITDAIDVSDANITNALNLGANNIVSDDIDWDLSASGQINIDATTINSTLAGVGVLEIDVTSTTNNNRALNIDYNWQGVSTNSGYASYIKATKTAGSGIYLHGQYIYIVNTQDSGVGSAVDYGSRIYTNSTGASSGGQKSAYGIESFANNTGATGGTVSAYGGYFSATGDGGGTSTAYGIYTTATGADTNYGIYVASGETLIQVTATQASQRLCGTQTDGVAGDSIIRDCGAGQTDLAEYYGSDGSLQPGDIVIMDENKPTENVPDPINPGKTSSKAWVVKSNESYDNKTLGIISANPFSESLGKDLFTSEENPVPVSLVGRVPVKVSTENGDINPGDPLTSSSIPGVAMKATKSGPIIGKALASFDCAPSTSTPEVESDTSGVSLGACFGKIVVFVSVGWYVDTMSNGKTQMSNLEDTTSISVQTLSAGTIRTDVLLVGDRKISMNKNGKLEIDGDVEIAGDLLVSGKLAASELSLGSESAGTETIKAGEKKLEVKTSAIKKDSKIFVTFSSDYSPASRYWVEQKDGSFTVNLDQPIAKNTNFNWLIIN